MNELLTKDNKPPDLAEIRNNDIIELEKAREELIQEILTLTDKELTEMLSFIEGGALRERCTERLVRR